MGGTRTRWSHGIIKKETDQDQSLPEFLMFAGVYHYPQLATGSLVTFKHKDRRSKLERGTLIEGYDIVVEDQWRRKYNFKIASFLIPTGLVSEALEVRDEGPGYEFRIFPMLIWIRKLQKRS
jgi:hypothetical protein